MLTRDALRTGAGRQRASLRLSRRAQAEASAVACGAHWVIPYSRLLSQTRRHVPDSFPRPSTHKSRSPLLAPRAPLSLRSRRPRLSSTSARALDEARVVLAAAVQAWWMLGVRPCCAARVRARPARAQQARKGAARAPKPRSRCCLGRRRRLRWFRLAPRVFASIVTAREGSTSRSSSLRLARWCTAALSAAVCTQGDRASWPAPTNRRGHRGRRAAARPDRRRERFRTDRRALRRLFARHNQSRERRARANRVRRSRESVRRRDRRRSTPGCPGSC